MRAAERTTQRAVADPQTRLDLLGQKGHARLEEPGRHILLAVTAIAVGPNLHVGQGLHRVVVVQVDLEITAHAVVADVEVLVEDVRRCVVADAESQVDHGAHRLFLGCGFEEHVEGGELALRDEVLEHQRPALLAHAVARRMQQLGRQRRLEPGALELEIVVDDVIEHATGAIDLVHSLVLGQHDVQSLEAVPFVGARRPVANHLQNVIESR